jgi:hypothetical protein
MQTWLAYLQKSTINIWHTEGPDRRSEGGECEPIKILLKNLTYVPSQTQHTSLLTRSRPHSYRKAIVPRNQARKQKSERKHKSVQAMPSHVILWQPKLVARKNDWTEQIEMRMRHGISHPHGREHELKQKSPLHRTHATNTKSRAKTQRRNWGFQRMGLSKLAILSDQHQYLNHIDQINKISHCRTRISSSTSCAHPKKPHGSTHKLLQQAKTRTTTGS